MITEKQLKIFGVFASKPFAEYTRKEIKKESTPVGNTIQQMLDKYFQEKGLIQ